MLHFAPGPRLVLAMAAMVVSFGGWLELGPGGQTHTPSSLNPQEVLIELVKPETGARLIAFSRPPTKAHLAAFTGCFLLSGEDVFPTTWKLNIFAKGECRLEPLSGRARLALGQKIDINTATVRDLTLIPRLGLRTAERVVEERARQGSFTAVRDLMTVSGIGAKSVEGLEAWLTVDEPAP